MHSLKGYEDKGTVWEYLLFKAMSYEKEQLEDLHFVG